MLGNLIGAEWLKLARRPLARALLAVFLGLLALYLGLWFMVVGLHEGLFGGARIVALGPAQIDQLKRQLSLPGVFGAVLGQVNSSGGILAIILAAGALGSDFGWGTLRVLLTRAPHRGYYLLAKLIALFLALLLGVGLALLLGAALALLLGGALGLPQSLSGRDLLVLPLGVARALYVILPYVLITFAAAAFGRSALAGVGGGLAFLAVDVGAGSLGALGAVSNLVLLLLNLLLQPNINTLVVANGQLYGLDQSVLASSLDLSALPSQPQAVLVIAAYSALSALGAYRALAHRDIAGAQ